MNSIAHVVFDLPMEGHFDYLIPQHLQTQVRTGVRVKTFLGPKPVAGFVVSTADKPSVDKKIKPLKNIDGNGPVFDERDLIFARRFAGYYGCSLGQALGVMLRHRQSLPVSAQPLSRPALTTLYHCGDGNYVPLLKRLAAQPQEYCIVFPDAFAANSLEVPAEVRRRIGLRSSMFEAFGRCRLVIVVDEDNPLYKQEQSPMYETRQVVLMAQDVYGFDIAFVSATPSVELVHLAGQKQIGYELHSAEKTSAKPSVIDATNYKFLEKGILSPPLRNAIQENLNAQRQTMILLNRRGSYRVTRCKGCGHVLKCGRCDSPLVYVRPKKAFECRHCNVHMEQTPACPTCGQLDWKSYGLGVEQLQKELSLIFSGLRTAYFEKDSQKLPSGWDVLIATQAVLRFHNQLKVHSVIIPDIDAELNRMDLRSSFKGWSLAQRARLLGKQLLVQTRNPHHHVLQALAGDEPGRFYEQELKLRRELGFAPFYHWAAVTGRAKEEKSAQSFIQDVYNEFNAKKPAGIALTPPQPDIPAKVRDQYRFRIMVGGSQVEPMVDFIKRTLPSIKRKNTVIVTLNVDP